MSLERALAYIEQGWAVFPIVPNTKRPLTRNGFKDATKDLAKALRAERIINKVFNLDQAA